MTIEVEFDSFALENSGGCDYDYVMARDGDGTQLMRKTCNSKPAAFTSISNIVKLIFHSDYSVNAAGFKLSWKAVRSVSLPTRGSIQSENYPGNYPNDLDKTYTIEVNSGKKIKITFRSFNLEDNSSCG